MEENVSKTLNEYEYYAFISYSTTDEKWAKWLHKHLENYNLPSAIRRSNNSLPKYIRPVFWYKTDLSGTELHSALEKELKSSRHLVLICSPESARSVWVNDEVKSFVEGNRTDSIIPFIVSGQPENPQEEDYCYPPILRDMPRTQMLRGIDVSKVGKQHALIDVVSTMFGLRFDALWQRHKRAQIRRNICYVLLAILLVIAGIGIWDYNRSIYEYYADYVDVYGIPRGVCKLTDEQKGHRKESLRFEYRRIPLGEPNAYSWRLYSVSYVNSCDIIQEYTSAIGDRFPLQRYFYNKETGKLSYVENFNEFENLQCRYQYSKRDGMDACVVDIEGGTKDRTLGFSTISSTSRTTDEGKTSNITRYIFLRDSLGHIIRKTFHSNNDYILDRSITADYDGVYGQSYQLDSIGRIVGITLLNREMEPFQTSGGFSYIQYEYDQFSNPQSCAYYNLNNNLTQSPNGWAKFIDLSDKYGNCIEERTYGTDLKLFKHEGAEIKKWEYDQRGFQTVLKFCDDKGNPCMSDYQYSICEDKYDKNGNNIESRYYDSQGKPVMAHDEYSICRMTYDEDGNQTSFAAFDVNDKPCYVKEGYSSCTMAFDDSHHCIEMWIWGIDGKPCLNNQGYSKAIYTWNDQNQLVEKQFYGVDGKPCLAEGGISKEKYTYDERGNKCEESYFGIDGKPCSLNTGFHIIRTLWNDSGNIIEQSFYDTHNKPCLFYRGYAYICYTYDIKGNLTTIEYYDNNRKPCLSDEGIYKVKQEYDDNGNVIKISYYDENNELTQGEDDCSVLLMEYNNYGNVTKYTYLDKNGNLCFNPNTGYAMLKCEYDSRGMGIKDTYYNEKGELFLYKGYFAIEESKYDSHLNTIESRYYNEREQPGDAYGVAIVKRKYDSRSNKIESSCIDKKGNLCAGKEGVALYVYRYNEKDQEISVSCYDEYHQPVLSSLGYFKHQFTYDERGNIIKYEYFGIDGKRIKRKGGYSIHIKKYDKRNRASQSDFFDENLKPCNIEKGYSKIVYEYSNNFNVNIRTCKYYDINGKLIKEETD